MVTPLLLIAAPIIITGFIVAPFLAVLLSRQDTLLHIAYTESSLQLFLIIVGGICICQTIYMIREDDDNVFKFFSIVGVALVIYVYLWAQVYMVLVKDDILFYNKDKYIQEYIDDYEYTKGSKNRKDQLIKDYGEQKPVRNQEDKDRQEYEEFKRWKESQKNNNRN